MDPQTDASIQPSRKTYHLYKTTNSEHKHITTASIQEK